MNEILIKDALNKYAETTGINSACSGPIRVWSAILDFSTEDSLELRLQEHHEMQRPGSTRHFINWLEKPDQSLLKDS